MYATGAWLRNSSTRLTSTTCDHTSRRQWMIFWMPSWPRDAIVALSISSKNLHFLFRHMYDTKSPRKASYLLHARSSTHPWSPTSRPGETDTQERHPFKWKRHSPRGFGGQPVSVKHPSPVSTCLTFMPQRAAGLPQCFGR